MNPVIAKLLKLRPPLSNEIVGQRANCFNAVKLFWFDTELVAFLGPEEFVRYLYDSFYQIDLSTHKVKGDVTVVWSRSSSVLPAGQVSIEKLIRKGKGYPFGMIIEHAFVQADSSLVFQKRDPTGMGPYELLPEDVALSPYRTLDGFEITRHRRI